MLMHERSIKALVDVFDVHMGTSTPVASSRSARRTSHTIKTKIGAELPDDIRIGLVSVAIKHVCIKIIHVAHDNYMAV